MVSKNVKFYTSVETTEVFIELATQCLKHTWNVKFSVSAGTNQVSINLNNVSKVHEILSSMSPQAQTKSPST